MQKIVNLKKAFSQRGSQIGACLINCAFLVIKEMVRLKIKTCC